MQTILQISDRTVSNIMREAHIMLQTVSHIIREEHSIIICPDAIAACLPVSLAATSRHFVLD